MDSRSGGPPPSGRVALLFSDVEGSTALLDRLGDEYGDVLDAHDRIMRGVFAEHGGFEFSNEGDAFGAAFADPVAAAAAAAEAQRLLDAHAWPRGERVRVRMGLHYGEPKIRGNDYWGEDVHFAARVAAAAHGGQVILSAAMRAALRDDQAISLGHHGLKDFPTPRELFQLVDPGTAAREFLAPRTLSTFRTNLPSIDAPLFGREEALADLDERLRDGRRLVTVVGPGGMGKTRVAVALGERTAARYPDGVAFVALAGVAPANVADAVADATAAPQGGADGLAAVLAHLERRRMLLVLDNCEHLAEAAADLVASVLARCPGVAVLATSQMPLDLTTETVRRLEPLPVESVADAPGAAVAMFEARAVARDPSFTIDAEERAQAEELCRLLEGLPLAIELAAARVRATGVPRLLAGLHRSLDALGAGARDLPERQRSLRAALDWTLSLLTETERDVFTGLGAFVASWSLEEAERLFAEDLDELGVWDAQTRLLDSSLVVVRGDGRFAMPERVRRHAAERLVASSDEARRRRQHAEVVGEELREMTLEMFVDYRRQLANVADLLPEALHALAWTRVADPQVHRHAVALIAPALAKVGRLVVVSAELPGLAPTGPEAGGWDDAAILYALGLAHAMRWSTDTEEEVGLFDRAARGFAAFGDPREAVLARYMASAALLAAAREEEAARQMSDVLATERTGDPRWRDEIERLVAGMTIEDEAARTRRTDALARLGVGAGTYAINHLLVEAYLAGQARDHHSAVAILLRHLREHPRQQLYMALNATKALAWVLADVGRDAEAITLRAGVHACYRSRTGAEHGDLMPEFGPVFAAAEARLGSRLREVVAAGERLSYDDLVDRAIEIAADFVSGPVSPTGDPGPAAG